MIISELPWDEQGMVCDSRREEVGGRKDQLGTFSVTQVCVRPVDLIFFFLLFFLSQWAIETPSTNAS